MKGIQMKEAPEKHPDFDPETYTNSIVEECYRIKAEISTEFKTQAEFFAYLKAGEEEEKDKRNGIKYVPYDPHPDKFIEDIDILRKEKRLDKCRNC